MYDLLQVRDQLPKGGETRRLPRVLNRETAGLTRPGPSPNMQEAGNGGSRRAVGCIKIQGRARA